MKGTRQSQSPLLLLAALPRRARGAPAVDVLLFLLGRLEDLEAAQQALIHAHHRARVVELATIIGCGEEGHEMPLGEELVAILDDL